MIDRFLEKVSPEPNTGCWIWTASTRRDGYGRFRVEGCTVLAHRVSYELSVGPIGDKHVLHKCDNPACVNPDHLFLGTNADNMRDRNAKGRQARQRGEANGSAKLSREDVLAIRGDPRTATAVAKEYGVHNATVSQIKRRKTWGHI
jgi:hypothetical protein